MCNVVCVDSQIFLDFLFCHLWSTEGHANKLAPLASLIYNGILAVIVYENHSTSRLAYIYGLKICLW